jgi:type VI secretion system secreted protein VgrG
MTQPSPNGDGFNELCFEDAKGNEKIYVHAQKDYDEMVEHDHSTAVKRHQTNTVKGNRTVGVTGNHSESVSGKQTVSVTKDRALTVDANETRTIKGKETLEVTEKTTETFHGVRVTTVEKLDDLETKSANKNAKIDGQCNVTVKDHFKVVHDSDELLIANVMYGNFTDKVEFKVGPNSLSITKNGKISIHADKEISLTCGGSSLTIKQDGTVEANGAKKVGMGSGSSSLIAEVAGITVSGPTISSSAIGLHEISGATIKVN